MHALTRMLQDKNERVRRRVIATLGELLFYIATQQQDNAAAAAGNGGAPPADPTVVWGISSNTYAQVRAAARDGDAWADGEVPRTKYPQPYQTAR